MNTIHDYKQRAAPAIKAIGQREAYRASLKPCPVCGEYRYNPEVDTECSRCKSLSLSGRKYVRPPEPKPEKDYMDSWFELRNAWKLPPPRYAEAKLADVGGSVRTAIERTEGGVYLFGPVGSGKTHAMSAIINERRRAGDDAAWVSFEELLADIRGSFDGHGSESDLVGRACEVDVLGLDDIGVSLTEFAVGVLERVLRSRYNHQRLTHATGNLSPSELAKRADPRVASVLVGMCKPIKLTGADRRLRERVTNGQDHETQA